MRIAYASLRQRRWARLTAKTIAPTLTIDEGARPEKCLVEIIHAKEQEQPVARLRAIGTRQRRMFVAAPLVKAQQNGSVVVDQLTEVVVRRRFLAQSEQRLV